MQNAKDTFYITLRDRLHLLNPLRTIAIRAVQRPGMLVDDAEAPIAELVSDVFTLRWTNLAISEALPNPMISMGCEIKYVTSGTQAASGLDRGRAIAEMDRELNTVLRPMCAQKLDYANTPASILQSQVFWTEPAFGTLSVHRSQISRITSVLVFSFQEPGDL